MASPPSAAAIKPQRPPSPQSLFDVTDDGAASTTAGSSTNASSVAASSIETPAPAANAANAVPNVDELRQPARTPARMPATFQQIRELHKLTGRNLMDCKQALNEYNCDLEAAVNALAISTRDAAAVASEGAPFAGNSAGAKPAAPAAEPDDDAVAGTGVCDQYRIDLAAASFGQCLCGFPRSAHGVSSFQKKPGALGNRALSRGCSVTSATAPERVAAASGRAAVAPGTAAAALGRAAASIERAAAAPERAAVVPGKVAAGTSPAHRDRRETRGVLHCSPPPRPPVANPNPPMLALVPATLTPVAVMPPVFTPGSTSPPARTALSALGGVGAECEQSLDCEQSAGMAGADLSTVDALAYPVTAVAAASVQLLATQPRIAPPVEMEASRARAFQARVRALFTEKVGEGSDANGAAVAALRQAQAEYLMPHDATAAAMAYTPARPRRPPAPPAPARDELSCAGGGRSLDIDARGSTAVSSVNDLCEGSTAVSLLQRNVRNLSAARVEVATRRELRLRQLEASLVKTSPVRPASAASFRDDEGSSGRASTSPTSSPSDPL